MARRLPPLNTLKAFESAAKNLSFTKAAEELHVTQAAISHQIKSLEDSLGVQLFRRLNRALLLTEEGQLLLPAVREALQILSNAVERLARHDASGPLTVSVLPSFATEWLVPRMSRFRQAHPEIELRVQATYEHVDFDRDDVDVALTFWIEQYPNLASERLMTEELFPVCSPRLIKEGSHPLKTPEDLKYHTLLHDDMRTNWKMWLQAAGVTGVDPERGPRFDASYLVQQAAIEGQGVALGRSALVKDALKQGLLVRPFNLSLPGDYAYYFVCPKHAFDRPKVKAFREWLQKEVTADEAVSP